MRSYTAHVRDGAAPELVAEGWSWGAALLGPFWFLLQRAWVPAGVFAGAMALVSVFAPPGVDDAIGLGFIVAAGLMGRDALRWSLERRGYAMEHVLVARDHEGALARLLHARPDLGGAYLDPQP